MDLTQVGLEGECDAVIKPVLQALVLADHIYIDSKTGKKIIAGTFNHLSSAQFPSQFSRSTFAFISFTEVRGDTSIVLRYVDLASGDILLELKDLQVRSNDPLATVEMVVEVPRFPMPHEGVFAFEVLAGEEMLGFLRIFVSNRGPDDSVIPE